MANFVKNEFLCFLVTNYDKLDKDSLISTSSEFYNPDELIAAKQLLIDECEKLALSDSILEYKKRRQNA